MSITRAALSAGWSAYGTWIKWGAIVVVLLSLWGWHALKVHDAYAQGKAEAEKACALKVSEANVALLKEHVRQQTVVDDLFQIDGAEILQALAAIDTRLDKGLSTYRGVARAKPLPVDCVLDPDRVRAINAGRQRPEARPD